MPITPIPHTCLGALFLFLIFLLGFCFDFLPLHRLPLGPQEIDPEKRAQRSAEQQQRQGEEGSDDEDEEADTVSRLPFPPPHAVPLSMSPLNTLAPLTCFAFAFVFSAAD